MDALALVGSWIVFYGIRFELGWVETVRNVAPPDLWFPAVVVAAYWLLVHAFFGLYRQVYLISRFDELIRVGKTTITSVRPNLSPSAIGWWCSGWSPPAA